MLQILNWLLDYFYNYPYIFVSSAFLLLFVFLPIPEEVILFTGGYLSAQSTGYIWIPTLITGIFWVIMTDYWVFFLVKHFGIKLFKFKIINKIIPEHKREKMRQYFERYGVRTIFFVRFCPGGFRNPTYAVAGLSSLKHRQFLTATGLGALLTTQVSFWIGYFGKTTLNAFTNTVNSISNVFVILFIVFVVIIISISFIKKYSKKVKASK